MRLFTRSKATHRPSNSKNRPDRLRLEPLDARDLPTVFYYGGNLLPHVEAQAVYYGNQWSAPAAGQPTPAALDASLTDLTGGAYMDALTRAGYGVGRGTTSAGAVDPVALTAGSVITDASIQARLQADIKAGRVQPPDANRLYVIYVEPNVAVNLGNNQGTTQAGVLGYHGAFGGTTAGGAAATIRYAVVAYPGGTARNSSLGTAAGDQLTAVASHELAEAVTDPDVNYARLGWYDPSRGEVGDITEGAAGALTRLDGYLVQLVAAPNDTLLTLSPPGSPPVSPPAPTAATITLSAGAVRYGSGSAFVTLTATVSKSVPSGTTLRLIYNGRVVGSGTVQVVNGVGQVSFTVQFAYYGSYSFTVDTPGSAAVPATTSNAVTVII